MTLRNIITTTLLSNCILTHCLFENIWTKLLVSFQDQFLVTEYKNEIKQDDAWSSCSFPGKMFAFTTV
jgi:hypothetical protein